MNNIDWYRNTTWNNEIETLFFDRLKRSRGQKSQQIKIQVYHLHESYPEIALMLINYLRTNCPADFWEQELCLYESKIHFNTNKISDAIIAAKNSIAFRMKIPSIQTDCQHWFAELVLLSEKTEEYNFALETLDSLYEYAPFPILEFRYHALKAILFARLNDPNTAKIEANQALILVDKAANDLQNPRKQNLGLVDTKNNFLYDEVKRIA